MTELEIDELAAILIAEHGPAALQAAQWRRDQHARERCSDSYRLWHAIGDAVERRLERELT